LGDRSKGSDVDPTGLPGKENRRNNGEVIWHKVMAEKMSSIEQRYEL
jgi:hypothetical protein